ncbi:hypothetical protein [Novosphingobium beihaiensis]|nr:hypothetical protein [Novosphingobium beihaiensis]
MQILYEVLIWACPAAGFEAGERVDMTGQTEGIMPHAGEETR